MKLRTRQQLRAEKRRAKKKARNIFESGLEALEIPTSALTIPFTATESLLYQVMLLHSDRKTGVLRHAKVQQYMEWIGVKSKTSIYAALQGLNEKGVIETQTDGWVTGTVLMRCKNTSQTEQLEMFSEKEMTGIPLNRALVHRQALKLMIAYKVAPLTQRVYWKLASDLDLQTGKLHLQKIKELAKFFGCKKASIYKAIRQINDAGLGSLDVDYGVEGHLEHVALAYGCICLAVERIKEAAKHGKTYAKRFEHYRAALYELFGVPIEALMDSEVKKGIAKTKAYMDQICPWEERMAVARE